jgi:hypothetical protein
MSASVGYQVYDSSQLLAVNPSRSRAPRGERWEPLASEIPQNFNGESKLRNDTVTAVYKYGILLAFLVTRDHRSKIYYLETTDNN